MELTSTVSRYLQPLYAKFFLQSMPAWQGGLLLGFLNVFMFGLLNKPFGVYPGMSLWGTWVYNLAGIKVQPSFGSLISPHLDVTTVLDIGLILGVLMTALLAREFKIRRDSAAGYAQGLLGGALMGLGTVMVPPCNVGGFFSAISALSMSGFGMMIGLIPGAYLGGIFLMWQAERRVKKMIYELRESFTSGTLKSTSSSDVSPQPMLAIFVLIIALALISLYTYSGLTNLAGVLIFGLLFGVVMQRSRLCFAAAFRDIFTIRDTKLMKSIVYGLTVGVLGFSVIKFAGWRAWDVYVFPFGLHNVAGGFIFGVGMVIAGGCGAGTLWRSAEGYVRLWFALVSGILVAAAWPLIYGEPVGKGWLYGSKVFIPNVIGWEGGLLVTLAAVWLWYLALLLIGRRRR